MILNKQMDRFSQFISCVSGKPNENYPRCFFLADMNQPSKVFILSKKYSVFAFCLLNKFPVIRTLHDFGHGNNIVSCFPQDADNLEITAFVCQEFQGHAGTGKVISFAMVSAA